MSPISFVHLQPGRVFCLPGCILLHFVTFFWLIGNVIGDRSGDKSAQISLIGDGSGDKSTEISGTETGAETKHPKRKR